MLKYAIKMYLREIFYNATYWAISAILLLSEYFSITQYRGDLAFVETTQFIVVPVYLFLVSVPFFTEDRVLTFELVMFREWSSVAVGRLLALLVSILPFSTLVMLMASVRDSDPFILPILASSLFYGTLVLLSTAVGGGSKAYVLSMGILFMLPFSSLVLVQNQVSLGNPVQGFAGYLTYILAPVYGRSVVQSGMMLTNPTLANDICIFLAGIWALVYLIVFIRREVHPSG
ncbi:hypothetical protein [Thermococcus waiotapuensis]|uniref:Uncharacterized protein n=1 Tax=Thermococcus waiotapuensis TaxID=90909 RepID=A0AAE4T4J9_9EURY|nr:hypothetical protein [Thermococcus waiotapuensis]MDV3104826.1 hypothetical protein [Thermococcus waiotapuensis]